MEYGAMSKKKTFPSLEVLICGKRWTAYLCSSRYINKKHDKATMAITVLDDKEIFFRIRQLSKETIIHELFHAYVWELGARSMDLDVDQMEELCAEMFSKHAEVMLATSGVVLAHVEQLKANKQG